MTDFTVFDDTPCALGEGALWHPLRQQLFWVDLGNDRLLTHDAKGPRSWDFDFVISAAGWIDKTHLLLASDTALLRFDIENGTHTPICALETDVPGNRANDGRADPFGGFWIGTMSKTLQPGAGAIYRYHQGEMRRLYDKLSIPNAICFAPGGDIAYFTDTPTGTVWRQALDAQGWPEGAPEVFLDLTPDHFRPDGAVVDATGHIWIAQHGHRKVTCHAPDGRLVNEAYLPATQTTCPGFGGPDLRHLFVTTARRTKPNPSEPDGQTYVCEVSAKGQAEHQVILE